MTMRAPTNKACIRDARRGRVILSKKPNSRETARTNRSKVGRRQNRQRTVCVGSPEIMTATPSSAMPVFSWKFGTWLMAMPQCQREDQLTIAVVPGSAPCAMFL